MIVTLSVTIFVESLVALIFCARTRRLPGPILLTSLLGNAITQSLLWIALRVFFQHYLAALIVVEISIWFLEGLLLFFIPANRLSLAEALLLSLLMNATSFGVGWFLPV